MGCLCIVKSKQTLPFPFHFPRIVCISSQFYAAAARAPASSLSALLFYRIKTVPDSLRLALRLENTLETAKVSLPTRKKFPEISLKILFSLFCSARHRQGQLGHANSHERVFPNLRKIFSRFPVDSVWVTNLIFMKVRLGNNQTNRRVCPVNNGKCYYSRFTGFLFHYFTRLRVSLTRKYSPRGRCIVFIRRINMIYSLIINNTVCLKLLLNETKLYATVNRKYTNKWVRRKLINCFCKFIARIRSPCYLAGVSDQWQILPLIPLRMDAGITVDLYRITK